jgi:hypothetical protein
MANEKSFEKQSKNSAKIKKTASSAAMLCYAQKIVFIIPRNHIGEIIERSLSPIDRSSILEEFFKDFELVKFQLIDDSTMEREEKLTV